MDAVQKMPEEQLRTLIGELLPALGEARMSAAHAKLQHNLLTIETAEAAKRAEVEHAMTRREVRALQESPRFNQSLSPNSPQASAQRHLELALKKCRELQIVNEHLEHRMHGARKLIRELSGKNESLIEDNQLLRQRIKQNRDHINAMRSSGAISVNGTPVTDIGTPMQTRTPKTPGTARSAHTLNIPPRSQDTFDALLFASEVLNNEANSVPSTPTRAKARKLNQPSHIRGAHSLSSLPSTPNRNRPITADNTLLSPTDHRLANHRSSLSTPGTQLTYPLEAPRQREDRDSTISASEDEGEGYSEYVPASQASQRATDMLRRSTVNSKDTTPRSSQKFAQPESVRTDLSQAKIFGHVKKPRADGIGRIEKRGGESKGFEAGRGPKKAKMGPEERNRVGLGIESWDDSVR